MFRRAWRPHQAVLGRVEGMAGYHDSQFTPTTHHLPGLVIYRFDAPLFFANARTFRDQVRHLAKPSLAHSGSSWQPSRSPMSTPRPLTSWKISTSS